MTADNNSVFEQLRRNAVALISLVVALSSLGYNTWRNEQTEANRNERQAAFEVLLSWESCSRSSFIATTTWIPTRAIHAPAGPVS